MDLKARGATRSFCGTTDLSTHRQMVHLNQCSSRTCRPLKGQGAIESQFAATAGTLKGQGATEYLVLLAVVLIIALVAIALLGFFPGMASDAQETQSKMYWQSATPIAITEWAAKKHVTLNMTELYVRFRNTGSYPIQITKVIRNGVGYNNSYCSTCCPPGVGAYPNTYFADTPYLRIPPGGEAAIGLTNYFGNCPSLELGMTSSHARSLCSDSTDKGTFVAENFGFEYVETVENIPITKKQIGDKPIVIRCM